MRVWDDGGDSGRHSSRPGLALLFCSLCLTLSLPFSPSEKIQDHRLPQTHAEGEVGAASGGDGDARGWGWGPAERQCRGLLGGSWVGRGRGLGGMDTLQAPRVQVAPWCLSSRGLPAASAHWAHSATRAHAPGAAWSGPGLVSVRNRRASSGQAGPAGGRRPAGPVADQHCLLPRA